MSADPSDTEAGAGLALAGTRVLVTGVSRTRGIGHAIACRAADLGASVFLHHYRPHDEAQPWGGQDTDDVVASVRAHLRGRARLGHASADLSRPEAAHRIVDEAARALGGLDALVCNHAASGHDGPLAALSPADLDHHWAVNARASVLLTQAFAALGPRTVLDSDGRPHAAGAVVLLTSGQVAGPMPEEIAYIMSKAALAGATASLADGLAEQGIRLNTVNPGPVNTGYMGRELEEHVRARFPLGSMPSTADPARLICWLLTDDAAWVTGQVISTEGGFRRG